MESRAVIYMYADCKERFALDHLEVRVLQIQCVEQEHLF